MCNTSRAGCPSFHSKSRKTGNIKKEINLGQSSHRMNVHHFCVKEQGGKGRTVLHWIGKAVEPPPLLLKTKYREHLPKIA